jgi:hypothetical protein
MAKFMPAFNINASDTHAAILAGQLVIQPGQWVYCSADRNCKPSRFVEARQGWLNVVHPTGAFARGPFPMEAFQRRAAMARANRSQQAA